jgi:hypothetical protein
VERPHRRLLARRARGRLRHLPRQAPIERLPPTPRQAGRASGRFSMRAERGVRLRRRSSLCGNGAARRRTRCSYMQRNPIRHGDDDAAGAVGVGLTERVVLVDVAEDHVAPVDPDGARQPRRGVEGPVHADRDVRHPIGAWDLAVLARDPLVRRQVGDGGGEELREPRAHGSDELGAQVLLGEADALIHREPRAQLRVHVVLVSHPATPQGPGGPEPPRR